MQINYEPRVGWRNGWDFVIVTTAAVVGLGNFMGFPAAVAEYGAMFVWVYLLCMLVISVPVFLCASLLGHHAQHNPVTTMQILSIEHNAKPYYYQLFKVLIVGLVISLVGYCVVSGQILAYLFHHQPADTLQSTITNWTNLLANIKYQWLMSSIFVFIVFSFSLLGIRRGVCFISYVSMLLLTLACISLLIWIAYHGELVPALHWLVVPSKPISIPLMMHALELAFFSLSVGSGIIMVYASYLPLNSRLLPLSMAVIAIDILVSLVAAVIVGAALFMTHTVGHIANPERLMFEVLPIVLAKHPYNQLMPYLFFFSAFLAVLTSAIATAEPVVTTLKERWKLSRTNSCLIVGGTIWLLLTMYWLSVAYSAESKIILQSIAFFCDQYLPLLGSLLILIFVGWKLDPYVTQMELKGMPNWLMRVFFVFVKFIAPIIIIVLLVMFIV